jgi:hypothetical protein
MNRGSNLGELYFSKIVLDSSILTKKEAFEQFSSLLPFNIILLIVEFEDDAVE